MEYQLRKDSVEAWQIGTEPVPDWAAEMLVDGTISDIGGVFSVSTAADREKAELGDYVTFQPTVWGEPTEEFPQGEVLAIREVAVIKRADFEALYEVPIAHAEPMADSEKGLATQPIAASDSEKPKRRK